MSRDEKIAWLKRYPEAEREIDRLTENIQRWASRRERMGGSIIPLPDGGGGDGSLLEQATEKIVALQDALLGKMDEQEAIKAEVERAISALAEQPQRDVLRYRYLQGYSMERIAVRLNYSYRQVLRHHVGGVAALVVCGAE